MHRTRSLNTSITVDGVHRCTGADDRGLKRAAGFGTVVCSTSLGRGAGRSAGAAAPSRMSGGGNPEYYAGAGGYHLQLANRADFCELASLSCLA